MLLVSLSCDSYANDSSSENLTVASGKESYQGDSNLASRSGDYLATNQMYPAYPANQRGGYPSSNPQQNNSNYQQFRSQGANYQPSNFNQPQANQRQQFSQQSRSQPIAQRFNSPPYQNQSSQNNWTNGNNPQNMEQGSPRSNPRWYKDANARKAYLRGERDYRRSPQENSQRTRR